MLQGQKRWTCVGRVDPPPKKDRSRVAHSNEGAANNESKQINIQVCVHLLSILYVH